MNKYRLTVAVLTMLLAAGFATAPVAHADTSYNVNLFGVVIKGYDSVAYFNQGEPVKGNKKFQVAWEGATWRFANAANLETFNSVAVGGLPLSDNVGTHRTNVATIPKAIVAPLQWSSVADSAGKATERNIDSGVTTS